MKFRTTTQNELETFIGVNKKQALENMEVAFATLFELKTKESVLEFKRYGKNPIDRVQTNIEDVFNYFNRKTTLIREDDKRELDWRYKLIQEHITKFTDSESFKGSGMILVYLNKYINEFFEIADRIIRGK